MSDQKTSGRTVVGTVINNTMDKTIVVRVVRKERHPIYGKFMKRFSKMYAHDSENKCALGDTVLIRESRPLSKTKRWLLIEILKQANVADVNLVDTVA